MSLGHLEAFFSSYRRWLDSVRNELISCDSNVKRRHVGSAWDGASPASATPPPFSPPSLLPRCNLITSRPRGTGPAGATLWERFQHLRQTDDPEVSPPQTNFLWTLLAGGVLDLKWRERRMVKIKNGFSFSAPLLTEAEEFRLNLRQSKQWALK